MAHVTAFEVNGLAGRKGSYAQNLNRDVNIFFGLNGSGKTSLLKILHSAMSGDADLLEDVPFKSASVSIYSLTHDQILNYSISSSSLQKGREQAARGEVTYVNSVTGRIRSRRSSGLRWTVQPSLKVGSWAHRYLPTSRMYEGADSSFRDPEYHYATLSDEALNRYFTRSLTYLWTNYTSSLLGSVRKAQDEGLARILQAVLATSKEKDPTDTLDTRAAYDRVKRFLGRQGSTQALPKFSTFEGRYSEDPKLRRVVSDINEVEEKIEKVMEPREELQQLIARMFSGGKRVRFLDRDIEVESEDHTPIPLATLSSGEKQVLRLFIEALLAEENTIIIDEPEISMHIDWQRSFVTALKQLNSNAQLILATHSPEIMADVADDKIFQL